MKSIVRNFRPQEVWYGRSNDGPIKDELLEVCAEQKVSPRLRVAGEKFAFGGADFVVLSPAPTIELKKRHEDDESMVLKAKFGATSMLLTGDIHKQVEDSLISPELSATVLKVPHHGSNTSASPEFLASVHPQFAIISAGQHNPFRHPRPEVLQRLSAAGIKTYRTDMLGPVTVILDGNSAKVSVLH